MKTKIYIHVSVEDELPKEGSEVVVIVQSG